MMPIIRPLILTLYLLPLSSAWAQYELPGTDIWMLHIKDNQVTQVIPAVQRPGYDNQPAFSNDGQWLYYTQGDLADDELGYTDIWRVNLTTGAYNQVTSTPISEFSPLPLPNAPGVSVVRVQTDGSQELWSIFIDSERPDQRIISAEPVGYHAWLDTDQLALFVLGNPEQGQTNRLELWHTSTDSGQRLADNIGRGLQTDRNGELFYVQNPSKIMHLQPGKEPRPVIGLYENGQDFGLGPNHSLWHGAGSKVYRYAPGDEHWQLMVDLQQFGLHGITRVMVNPAGDQVAVVINE